MPKVHDENSFVIREKVGTKTTAAGEVIELSTSAYNRAPIVRIKGRIISFNWDELIDQAQEALAVENEALGIEIDNIAVGRRIKQIRQGLGFTMKQFGQWLDVSVGAVNHWEKGNNRPKITHLKAIADLENITVDELLHGIKKESNAGTSDSKQNNDT